MNILKPRTARQAWDVALICLIVVLISCLILVLFQDTTYGVDVMVWLIGVATIVFTYYAISYLYLYQKESSRKYTFSDSTIDYSMLLSVSAPGRSIMNTILFSVMCTAAIMAVTMGATLFYEITDTAQNRVGIACMVFTIITIVCFCILMKNKYTLTDIFDRKRLQLFASKNNFELRTEMQRIDAAYYENYVMDHGMILYPFFQLRGEVDGIRFVMTSAGDNPASLRHYLHYKGKTPQFAKGRGMLAFVNVLFIVGVIYLKLPGKSHEDIEKAFHDLLLHDEVTISRIEDDVFYLTTPNGLPLTKEPLMRIFDSIGRLSVFD